MTKKTKKQPKLRFSEFADDWEQRKFSEGASEIGDGLHGTPTYCEAGNVYFINGNNLVDGKILISAETKKVNESQQSTADKSLDDTTILMSINGTIGNLAYYSGERLMLGKSAAYIKVSEFDKRFVYAYLQAPSARGYFMDSLTGTTIKNLGLKAIREMIMFIPQDVDEQKRIGKFFDYLDHLIALRQRELDELKELKQGMLQKMFPKKGEATPEIRFPEFTGDWEHRKFGEVLETVTDYVAAGSFADLAKNVEYKDYPDYAQLIRTMDLKNGFTSAQEVYVDKNAFDYLHRVNMDKECIILPNIGNCGEVYYVKPESLPYEHNVLGPNAIFVRSETCANNFLSILLQAKDFQTKLKLIVSPNGQTKFNKTELKGIDLILPGNVYEQEKIGQYFENLDSLIALQQKEIDGYKELKKGLLQQMFC